GRSDRQPAHRAPHQRGLRLAPRRPDRLPGHAQHLRPRCAHRQRGQRVRRRRRRRADRPPPRRGPPGDRSDRGTVTAVLWVDSGTTVTGHGLLAVPPPATLKLLTGVPVAAHHSPHELCTPTGAALLVTLAQEWGPLPACTPTRIGVGAGSRELDTHPNVIRLVFAADDARLPPPAIEELLLVESTVDDLDPRLWPDVLATLRA